MVTDWHAHYPMRVVSEDPHTALETMRRASSRPGFGNKLRAFILRVASMFFSNRNWWSGYRIEVEYLRSGDVCVAMSVLYKPFEEMDIGKSYKSPPESGYFPKLIEDLEAVEAEVSTHGRDVIRLVHNRAELDECLTDGATALVHCVEGGFHLGSETSEIEANVAELARRGVAYITVAHLFFRGVATNAPAIPFISDSCYDRLFPQPENEGLTDRGVALVRAMMRNRILVDISHMRGDAVKETLALLDELDPELSMPVVATHAGFRFGKQEYMLDEETVLAIKRRNGLIGLIMAQHQLNDGLTRVHSKTFEESFPIIRRHVDEIVRITGNHHHTALGTDFDGFIKPTMGGLERMTDLSQLEDALRDQYQEDADLICSENTLRVLRQLWPVSQP
jgi:microsomal dipeptidase-like Zn-dependent dipeptidase